jgi:hypothetical protein
VTFSDRLRSDLWPLIGNRPVYAIAKDIGVSRTTLWKFLKGEPIGAQQLDRIDNWVLVHQGEQKPAIRSISGD